jgi:hypothetical protein
MPGSVPGAAGSQSVYKLPRSGHPQLCHEAGRWPAPNILPLNKFPAKRDLPIYNQPYSCPTPFVLELAPSSGALVRLSS